MTTQYTSTLKLALPVTGELSGTWGDVVNDNITSMIEQAIAGLSTINTWTGNAHTLTTANGTTSESRCAMLVAATGGGAPTAAAEIICPAAAKLYVLQNNTSFAVTLKTSAGTGVAVAAGDTAFLFCDATNVNSCVTTIVNGHITGNLTVDGNTTLGNATSDTITATARFNTDLIPSTDNARDLGSSANSWKDLYIDGTATIATLNVTTIDTTNLEVTNIKAKDGTAAIVLADVTGVATIAAAPVMTALTASKPVFTDASKALTSSGTLAYDQGGTGQTSYAAGDIVYASATNTLAKLTIGSSGQRLVVAAGLPSWATDATIGTVTSVAQSFTGGLISVAGSPITTSGTLALTVAGTSGGVPYFSSGTTWATSAALAASALVIGGGAGAAPSTTTTGTGVVTALGVNTGTAGAFVVNGGALGTPSSGTVTNLTGTASININGTVGATTPTTGAFTTVSATVADGTNAVTVNGSTVGGFIALRPDGTNGQAIRIGGSGAGASTLRFLGTGDVEYMRLTSTGLEVTGTLSATGITTLSAATTPLLLSGAGSSSTTLPSNYAIRINAGVTAANYGGIFFDGSTTYDSFFGRVPTALSGINDGVGYVTYASGAPTLRTLFSSTGLAVTGTLSATGLITATAGVVVGTGAGTYAAGSLGFSNANEGFVYRPPVAGLNTAHNFQSFAGTKLLGITDAGSALFVGTLSGGTSGTGYSFSGSAPAGSLSLDSSGSLSVLSTSALPAQFSSSNASATLIQQTNTNASVDLFYRFRQNAGAGNWYDLTMEGSTNAFTIDYNDNERLRIDSSGNVGIGTSSPGAKLHVVGSSGSGTVQIGTSAGTNQYQLINFGGSVGGTDYGWQIGRSSNTSGLGGNGAFYFYDLFASATRMSIDSSGNLGLGVTPSAWDTSVYKAMQFNNGGAIAAYTGSVAPIIALSSNWYYNAGDKYVVTGPASQYVQNQGVHQWFNAPSGTAGNAISFTQAMTLDASGNLGIGTSSPGTKLDVVGAARVSGVSGTGYQGLRLFGTGTAYNYMQMDNTGGVINFGLENSSGGSLVTGTSAYATVLSSYSNTPIQFGTNNTLRMTLDSSGNLGIGTSSPAYKLDVRGTISSGQNYGGVLAIYDTLTSSRVGYVSTDAQTTGNNDTNLAIVADQAGKGIKFFTNNSATLKAFLDSSGNLTISTGNLIVGTAGKGIDFSATSSGSGTMTSELLADYEEGTWVPTAGSGLTVTGTFVSSGTYTKVGRLVTVNFAISATLLVCSNSTQLIAGLPFSHAVDSIGSNGVLVNATPNTMFGLNVYGSAVTLVDSNLSSGNAYGSFTYPA